MSSSTPVVEGSKTKLRMIPRYADAVISSGEPTRASDSPVSSHVRDPLAVPATTLVARRRSMSERLEVALSWNAVAAELRTGMKAVIDAENRPYPNR